jgi:hypothetical protein
MISVSEPSAGAMVSKPNVPAGGAALATPVTSNAEPPVTAATATPDTNLINNLFLCTI